MRAMVEMAAAGVEVARKAGHPDFSLGAMAELRADPSFVRPLATLGLPIWRDRIAATVAAAEARHEAGAARVSAEQLNLAADFAQDLAMVRESDRMIAYIDRDALPSVDRSIATAAAAYQSGAASEAMIPESQVMALAMRLERAGTLRGRELAPSPSLLPPSRHRHDPGPGGRRAALHLRHASPDHPEGARQLPDLRHGPRSRAQQCRRAGRRRRAPDQVLQVLHECRRGQRQTRQGLDGDGPHPGL
jgi:hypothetical protein